jgi:hypothetical protein
LGILEPGEDLANRPEIASEIMTHWVAHGQTSCHFAAGLSRDRKTAKWDFVGIRRQEGEDVCGKIADLLSAAEQTAEAIIFCFPHVIDPESLVDLINTLCACDRWWWEPILMDTSGSPTPSDEVLVSLKYLLSDGRHASWVLGFGPFDFLAFTRQAPITSLAMRVNPYKRVLTDRAGPDGIMPVHLADMNSLLPDEKFGRVKTATEENKRNILNGDLLRAARARVTFRIPKDHAQRLVQTSQPRAAEN